uniref:apolipoprotein A-IV-like n=1 Tax=Pristiophorus japonicus TaxID=55135 RepID=UPI00398F03F7
MLLKTTVVVLIVLTVPGLGTDSNGGQGSDTFWSDISQLTKEATDSADQIQNSEIGQRLNYLIKLDVPKLSSISDDYHGMIIEFAEKLRKEISEEMELLREKLSPVAGVDQRVSRNIELFDEELHPPAEERRQQLNTSIEGARQTLPPDTEQPVNVDNPRAPQDVLASLGDNPERLKSLTTALAGIARDHPGRLDQKLQDLFSRLIPKVKNATVTVRQQVGALNPKVMPHVEDLQAKLNRKVQLLKQDLLPGTTGLKENVFLTVGSSCSPNPSVEDLNKNIDHILATFDQTSAPGKVINAEDMLEKQPAYREPAAPLAKLFLYSDNTGTYPTMWKTAQHNLHQLSAATAEHPVQKHHQEISEEMELLREKLSPVAGVDQRVSRNIELFDEELHPPAEERRQQLNTSIEGARQTLPPDTEQPVNVDNPRAPQDVLVLVTTSSCRSVTRCCI